MSLEKGEFFSYSWHIDEKEKNKTIIRIYGLNEKNENVCIIIDNFTPYVYLELPIFIDWNTQKAQLLSEKLDYLLGDQKPTAVQLMFKRKLYYANLDSKFNHKLFPYLLCCFNHTEHIKQLSYIVRKPINVLSLGKITLKIHEHNATPILQLTSLRQIPTAGWINFVGKRVSNNEKLTYCKHEFMVKWKHLEEKKSNSVARPLIMGYDIEVNSSDPTVMPRSQVLEDKIFQISCVFSRQGNKPDKYEKYLLTLGEPDFEILGKDIEVQMYDTEHDLLIGFIDIIQEKQPNIIIGYNIFTFDIPYMIDRAKILICFDKFVKQGMDKYGNAKERTIEWSSSAYKNQSFQFLDAEGRLFVDLLPLVRRDYKMNNYQLKTIASHFLKDITKDPLDAKGIFKCYRLGMQGGEKGKKALGTVGKYCIKDSELVVRLFETLTTWVGLCEMSKVTNVPIFMLYTQGQQLKVFSQVYKKATHENIVVEKDVYITKDTDHYMGATVFPPTPGIYENVVPMDFAALYPTTIIANNICWSTLVTDDNIPDELCTVTEWNEHSGCCIAEDTLITLENSNTKIDTMDEYTGKILSYDEKQNGLVISTQTKFYNQGSKECIEILLEDGTTLTCTPEHKIMTIDNGWVESKNLLNKSVLVGICYPEYNIQKDIADCKGWSFQPDISIDLNEKTPGRSRICAIQNNNYLSRKITTDTVYNCDLSFRIVRLLGFLLTDGHVSAFNNKCTLFIGHPIDVDIICKDIKYICKRILTVTKSKYCWKTSLPHELSIWMKNITGVVAGKRVNLPHTLPSFILDEKCPLPIIREFLSGLFSGDGCTISINKCNLSFGSISLAQSSNLEHIESLQEWMVNIQKLLNKFDISSRIYKHNRKDISSILSILRIYTKDIKKFYLHIGFKYCIHKAVRLNAIISYIKLRDNIERQCNWVVNRAKELKGSPSVSSPSKRKEGKWRKILLSEAVQIAHNELKANEYIFNNKYSLPDYQFVVQRLKRTSKYKGIRTSMRREYFPTVFDYLKQTGAIKFFIDKPKKTTYAVPLNQNSVPIFYLRVVSIKNVGLKKVYDIEVENSHNFLANGIVVHNCHDPKEIRKKELGDIIKNKEAEIKDLRKERDKRENKNKKEEYNEKIAEIKEKTKPYREERSQLQKTKSKFVSCCTRKYRWLKKPIGVLPEILTYLLETRASTKKEMKGIKAQLKELKENDEKYHDLATYYEVLDQRQLALKVSCNSAYGSLGVRRGYLPFMAGAMVTTYKGRMAIEKAAETIQKEWKGKLIYGDSVTPDTPILCRLNGMISYKTIDNISTEDWKVYHTDKEISNPVQDLEVWTEKGFTKIKKVIRHKCQKKIYEVVCNTGIVHVTEDHSLLTEKAEKITPKSLKTGDKILTSNLPDFKTDVIIDNDKAQELGYSCALNKESIPYYIFTTGLENRKTFFEQYWEMKCDFYSKESNIVYCEGKLETAKLYYLVYSIKQGCRIVSAGKKDTYGLVFLNCEDKNRIAILDGKQNKTPENDNIVQKISIYDENYNGYVYDLETENHHFSAGIGQIIVHNTDSNYVSFPHLKTSQEIWDYALKVASEVSKLFPKPMSLAFEEKIYLKFLLLTKKRYMSIACERDGIPDSKISKKGVLLSRRDNSPFIRNIYEKVIMKIFNKEQIQDILYYIIQELNKLCSSSFPISDFIITKSVGDVGDFKVRESQDEKGKKRYKIGDYTVKLLPEDEKKLIQQYKLKDCDTPEEYYLRSLPAQVQLAEKMRKRGMLVSVGTRLEYVITTNGGHNAKQYIKIESAEYFSAHSSTLKLDYLYYLKQLSNPLDQVLNVLYKDIKDFTLQQYKLRLQKTKILEELLSIFNPKLKITAI